MPDAVYSPGLRCGTKHQGMSNEANALPVMVIPPVLACIPDRGHFSEPILAPGHVPHTYPRAHTWETHAPLTPTTTSSINP